MRTRNYVIDLLRFIFCFMIVVHHSFMMYGEYKYAPTGYMGVEFFFIITGFYMMDKASQLNGTSYDLWTEVRQFLFHKIIKILPILGVSIVFSVLLQYIAKIDLSIIKNIIKAIPELLMLQMFGISSSYPTGAAWYLSAMFIALTILYPVALKYYSWYKNVGALFIALVLIGYIMHCTCTIGSDPGSYLGLFPKGVLRAFAEISLGAFLYPIVKEVKQNEYELGQKIIIGIVEVLGYICCIYIMLKYQAGQTDFYVLVLLLVSISITLSEKSILFELLNKRVWGMFGNISMVWFLNNFYVARCLPAIFTTYHNKKLLYIYIIFSFVLTLGVQVCVNVLNQIIKIRRGLK